MNRAQSRAQWRSRIRRERAAAIGTPRPAFTPPVTAAKPLRKLGTHVRVNELEFRGFENSAARRIAASFERELTLLLQSRPLPMHWRENPAHIRTAPVRLRSLTDTWRIGEQLAHAVFAAEADDRQTGMKR